MSDEFRKIEYDNLYKEILENANKVYLVLNICITSAAALLSFALTLDPSKLLSKELVPFLLLLPFSVILPSMTFIISSHNSTVRIATYLRVFYEEEQKDISWQRRIQKLRQADRREKKRRVFNNSLQLIFLTLGFICISLSCTSSFYIWNQSFNRIERIFHILLVLYLGFQLMSLSKELKKRWSTEFFDRFIKDWETLKEEEKRI